MKHLIAIDPGSETSAIVLMTVSRNPKLVYHQIWKDTMASNPTDVIEYILMFFSSLGIQHAAIEDQFLGKNPNTLKVLARNGGRWQEACSADKLAVQWVPPRTWQSKVLGSKWGTKREQIEKMMTMVARQDTGKNLSTDECAAWCIGKYVIGNYLQKHGEKNG